MEMLQLNDLHKTFNPGTVNEKVALNGVSLHMEAGDFATIVGSNGAGKSTIMNILTGYLAATEGQVTVAGHPLPEEADAAKACVGYLPEQPPLYDEMTVESYLCFVCRLRLVVEADIARHVRDIAAQTNLSDVLGRRVGNLSKGYRQRTGLAQALIGDPKVLILDEPTVGLDPKQIIEIRDLIRKLGENHTVILSSHILSEVSAVCDYIMIIAHGKLVASDSPENLQKLMSGSMELDLEVKGSIAAVKSSLQEISQIDRIEENTEAPKDIAKLKVISKENADIREQVFYALAEAKLPILEMTNAEKSLEDIFLELTEDVAPTQSEKHKLFSKRKKPEAEETVTTKEAE